MPRGQALKIRKAGLLYLTWTYCGRRVLAYLACRVRMVRVMCSGMVHPNLVIEALTKGADGVLMCGCHPGDYHYQDGNRKAEKRADALRLMLADFGLEEERFRLEWVSAAEGPRFAEVVSSFTEQVQKLGPSPRTSHKNWFVLNVDRRRQPWVPSRAPVQRVHSSHYEVIRLTASLFIGSILELFMAAHSPAWEQSPAACEGQRRALPAACLGIRGWQHVRIGGVSNADRH